MKHIPDAFDISVIDPTYEQWEMEDGDLKREEFERFLLTASRDAFPDLEISFGQGNIGYGADLPTIVLTIAGLAYIIKSGKDINDGLEGWIGVGEKVSALWTKIRSKVIGVRLSRNAAISVGLAKWSRKHSERFSIEDITILEHEGASPLLNVESDSERFPESVYIVKLAAVRIEDGSAAIFVVSVKANGHVRVGDPMIVTWWGFDDDESNMHNDD